jgi:signal transduction histidine kinase
MLARVCAVVAMGAFVAWYYDGAAGFNTIWDHYASISMSATFAVSAGLLWRRPTWFDQIVGVTLAITGVYFLGSLYVASQLDSPVGLYSMASNAQFMPLVYVGAFVAMRRGAAWLSWAHYGAIVALYLVLFGLQGPPATEAYRTMSKHVWVVLLFIHPACILALQYISTLKGRLHRAESEAQQSKERFLAMLSHEIRSPLQAMLGSIELLAMKVRGGPEQRAVDRLRQAAAQLDTHLRDVTEYTRLDSPGWRLHSEPTDVIALVDDITEQLRPQAERQGLVLATDIAAQDTELLRRIELDPTRVRQILLNLLSNALKYTLTGEVRLKVARLTAPRSALSLEVADTGIGIPPEDLQRVFEPYIRLEDERVQRASGAGLGLAVVQRLVRRLGGQLEVHSTLDLGSRFTVTLPLAAPQ